MNAMPTFKNTHKKILGILGGMGPYASLDLYQKILELTPAQTDQDHLHIILDSNSDVPSRTEAILKDAQDPVPEILHSLRKLEAASVDLIAIPCHTSHYYFSSFRSAIKTPVINMVECVASHVATNFSNVKYVGVLGSSATMLSGMYQKELLKYGFQPLVPSKSAQDELVSQAIYAEKGIKAGYKSKENTQLLLEACDVLIARGAEVIISACTEIPLVINNENSAAPFIDSTSVLAQVCVNAMLMPDVFEDVVEASRVKQIVPHNMLV